MILNETAGRRPTRVHGFDTARGCAVVLVVFMHVTQQLQLASPLPTGLLLLNWSAASIRMPLLFMLSGVLASRYLTREGRDVARRAGHFLWLLTVWGVVAALVELAGSGHRDVWSRIEIIILPESPLWFIWALAIFTATIPIVARHSPKRVVTTALVIACLSYVSPFHELLPDLPVLKTARQAIFFYIGLTHAKSIIDLVVTNRARVILALTGTGAALHAVNGLTDRVLNVSLLLIPEKLVLSMLALALAASLPQTRVTAGLQWLGRRTLPIFLGHMLFVDYLVGMRFGAGQLELSAGITLCSIAASIGLKQCLDAAGFAWMYQLPGAELKKGKRPHISSRAHVA